MKDDSHIFKTLGLVKFELGGNNRLHCSCILHWMKDLVQSSVSVTGECGSPDEFKGDSLVTFAKNVKACEAKKCPCK